MRTRRATLVPAIILAVMAGTSLLGAASPSAALPAPPAVAADGRAVGRHASAVVSALDATPTIPPGSVTLDGVAVLAPTSPGTGAVVVAGTRSRSLDCGVGPEQVDLLADGDRQLLVLVATGRCTLDGHELRSPDASPAMLVLDLAAPAGDAVATALPLDGATGVMAMHPDGRHVYLVDRGLEPGRTHLRVIDLADLDAPARVFTIRLGTGLHATSLAVDPDGLRLFAASGTHTVVLDTADPARPSMIGRLSDYMVRNHHSVQVAAVEDPRLGPRRYLTVTSRLGGSGCPSGSLHVYDITGDLLQRPLMAAESALPHAVADGDCSLPLVTVDPVVRRLRVEWTDIDGLVRRDWFPYRTSPSFLADAQYCVLLPA